MLGQRMMAERPHREMVEKSRLRETFFSLKSVAPARPDSVHTEFMETDWDDDDILSEMEDTGSSPRQSIDSVSAQVLHDFVESFVVSRQSDEAHVDERVVQPDLLCCQVNHICTDLTSIMLVSSSNCVMSSPADQV